jgi:DNA-binding NarL/FixJ family response regulator
VQSLLGGDIYVVPRREPAPREADSGQLARIRAQLTERQLDVLGLMANGLQNKEIARRLHLADSTVRLHVNAVLRGLEVHNRTQAAMAAWSAGLVST